MCETNINPFQLVAWLANGHHLISEENMLPADIFFPPFVVFPAHVFVV